MKRRPKVEVPTGPAKSASPMLQAAAQAPAPPRPYPQVVYSESKIVFSDGRVEETKTTYPYHS